MDYIYLDEQRLTESIDGNVVVLDMVTSTNDYLEQAYESGRNLALVTAEGQSQGKGRVDGRVFFSPKYTGIYMSMLVDLDCPLEDSVLLTPAVAVATCNAIQQVTGTSPSIKWINDLYLSGKKVAGILCKALQVKDNKLQKLLVGIGINVNRPTCAIPAEIEQKITFLSNDEEIDRNTLIAEIYTQVKDLLTHMDKQSMLSQYRSNNFLIGKSVGFWLDGTYHQAVAVSIDDQARLVVQSKDEIFKLDSGEVSLTNF